MIERGLSVMHSRQWIQSLRQISQREMVLKDKLTSLIGDNQISAVGYLTAAIELARLELRPGQPVFQQNLSLSMITIRAKIASRAVLQKQ